MCCNNAAFYYVAQTNAKTYHLIIIIIIITTALIERITLPKRLYALKKVRDTHQKMRTLHQK